MRYTVPQHITSNENDVKIYFRVSDVHKDVTVEAKDGDEVIFSRKKQRVAPGEMESILIKSDVLKNIKSGAITVGVKLNG